MIFGISGTKRTVRKREVSVSRDQTVVLNLIQSLPLQHRHLCKVNTWICPFSFHVKEVSLHLFVCLFFFVRSGQRVFFKTGVGFADFTTGESHRL